MITVGFYGEEAHYKEHMRPLVDLVKLDPEMSTTFFGKCNNAYNANVVVVASYKDLVAVRELPGGFEKIIYMEHGAGQAYNFPPENKHLKNYYSGGERKGVDGIMVPGNFARNAYVASGYAGPIIEIGCPKLLNWTEEVPKSSAEEVVVGLAFHWDCGGCTETSATWHQWLPKIWSLKLHNPKWKFVGFCHPRNNEQLTKDYKFFGIEKSEKTPIAEGVDIMLCDNTSLGWEFMWFGKPTLWLDGWQYRNVAHGLRFSKFTKPFCINPNWHAEDIKSEIQHLLKPKPDVWKVVANQAYNLTTPQDILSKNAVEFIKKVFRGEGDS